MSDSAGAHLAIVDIPAPDVWALFAAQRNSFLPNAAGRMPIGAETALPLAVRKPMMKIQTQESDGEVLFTIEGRLAGAFVPELDGCWQAARRDRPECAVAVDVKSVTCIDRAGRLLLERMHTSGVRFRRAGLAIQDILEQVMEQPECKH